MDPERIVIVGGGFASVTVAQNAERHMKASVDIVVISRDNHLVFSPFLPDLAARGISLMHVAVHGRNITRAPAGCKPMSRASIQNCIP